MTSIVTIDSIKPTAKSLVIKAGAREYFAKKDSGLDAAAGWTIEADTKASDFNGKSYVWIEKWKRVASPSSAPPSENHTEPERFTATGVNMAFLPFVSNVVAHAIAAGRIEGPADIHGWANAAYATAQKLGEPVPF